MGNQTPMEFFRKISQFPRSTGDEKAVSDYLLDFARERGLTADRDEHLNVVIRKPGTPGYENAPILVVQSHLDMVYIKDEGCDHDYHSPLVLREEQGMIRATGTSLGADNGAGTAYTLALLDSDNIPHPPLEGLFTTGEEVGMEGIIRMSGDFIRGRRMLNTDSEEDDTFTVGCAGGVRVRLSLEAAEEEPDPAKSAFLLQVQGLKGGHSGFEIQRGRGNALRLLGRALRELRKEFPTLQVGELSGGSKMNAIPDRASARVYLEEELSAPVSAAVIRQLTSFRAELAGSDPEVTLTLTRTEPGEAVLSRETLDRALFLLLTLPTGVQSMNTLLENTVESSNNIGILRCEEGEVTLTCAIRSVMRSLKYAILEQIRQLAYAAGAKIKTSNDYPEWIYQANSPLRDTCVALFEELRGKPPRIQVIHAGLECGYFRQHFPGIDIVSLGPNIHGAHTPEECMEIASFDRVWEYIKALCARLRE